jgi:uncharacterized protein YegL
VEVAFPVLIDRAATETVKKMKKAISQVLIVLLVLTARCLFKWVSRTVSYHAFEIRSYRG